MVPVLSLWLPILLSAVAVFVVSSLIHMVVGWHAGDWTALPDEGAVMEVMARQDVTPGQYTMPHAASAEAFRDPAYVEKRERGPVAFITVLPSGNRGMGAQLGAWFLFSLAVSVVAAYLTGRALGPGADFPSVFRFATTVPFLGYAFASWSDSIWYGRSWGMTLRNTADGFIYAAVTGAVFGWLWPGM